VDYRHASASDNIRHLTNTTLAHAVDCISDPESTRGVRDSLGPSGGAISQVLREPPINIKKV
jgi:hypothetical protein